MNLDPVQRAPRVSVVIIFLNGARFLEEAIRSVQAQTLEQWELLLVDDGSTDGSTEIARRWVQRDPGRIRYFEHEGHVNRGMSATRNLGIRQARGEFVAFLDSDDVWLPHKLARQVALFEAHPEAGMVYGATRYCHSWTNAAEDRSRDHVPDPGVRLDTLFRPPDLALLLYPLGTGASACPSDLMVRRTVAESVRGFEEDFRGLYEDQVFLAKVYLRHPVFVSGETWALYRIHDQSCVSVATRAGEYEAVRRRFLKWLLRDLAEEEPAEARVAAAARAALRSLDEAEPAPALHRVDLGSLRRVTPISRDWGFDRGRPIDRYYIESFLAAHAESICGRVLEIGDPNYTRRFGGERVTRSDVLHLHAGHAEATIVADLTSAAHVPSGAFDCVIVTQTLQLIYDLRAAVQTLHRILKPGGVVLATVPGITHTNDADWGGSWCWTFTPHSARRIFAEAFAPADIEIRSYGNVLAAVSFLHGLATEELEQSELDRHASGYEVTIAVKATRARAAR